MVPGHGENIRHIYDTAGKARYRTSHDALVGIQGQHPKVAVLKQRGE